MAEFDPLHSGSPSPSRGSDNITRPRPISNQTHLVVDPASLKQSKNPFLKPEQIRGSHSESNLSVLENTSSSSPSSIHSTKSQVALASKRMGMIETSLNNIRVPQQGDSIESSGGSIENPFLEEPDHTQVTQQQAIDKTRFWLDQGDSDIEMRKVDHERDGHVRGMGKKTASLDMLNERDPMSEVVLDYNFRRKRTITSSNPSFMTQSFEVPTEAPPIIKPSRSKTSTVQISKAISKSPKMFRKKVCQY